MKQNRINPTTWYPQQRLLGILLPLGLLIVIFASWYISNSSIPTLQSGQRLSEVYQPIMLILAIAGVLLVMYSPDKAGVAGLATLLYIPILPNLSIGPFEMSVTAPIAIALFMVAVWRMRSDPKAQVLSNWQVALLLFLGFAFLLSFIYSTSYRRSLSLLPNMILYLLLLAGLMILLRREDQLVFTAKTILVLMVVTSLWKYPLGPLRTLLDIPSLGINGLIFSFHPAFALCLVAILRTLPQFSRNWRWLALLGLGAILFQMVIYETRAAWLAATFMLLLALISLRPRNLVPLIAFMLGIGLLFNAQYSGIISKNLQAIQTAISGALDQDNYAEQLSKDDKIRLLSTRAGLAMFRDRPLIGWGPNIYNELKQLYVPWFTFSKQAEGAFNSWVQVLAEMGFFGFAAVVITFLTPLLITMRSLWRNRTDRLANLAFAFALGVIGLGVHLFFIDLMYSFVWFHVGLALAAARLALDDSRNKNLIPQTFE